MTEDAKKPRGEAWEGEEREQQDLEVPDEEAGLIAGGDTAKPQRVSHSDLTITKYVDKASTTLLQ